MQSKLVLIAALVVAITAALTSAVPIGLSQLPEHDVGVDAIPAETVEDVDADFSQMSENELEATAFPSDAAEAVGTDFTQVSEKESTPVTSSHISTVDFGKTVLASLQANMQKLSTSMDALKAASDKAAVDAAASKSIFDSSVADAASKKASMESSMQSSVTASQRCSESQNAVIAADNAKTQAINTAKDVSAIDRELALIAQVKEKLVELTNVKALQQTENLQTSEGLRTSFTRAVLDAAKSARPETALVLNSLQAVAGRNFQETAQIDQLLDQIIKKLQEEKSSKQRAVVTASASIDRLTETRTESCAASEAKKQEVRAATSQYDAAVIRLDANRRQLETANSEAASSLKSTTDFKVTFESEKATMNGFMQFLSGGMKCSAAMGSAAEQAVNAPASCSAIYQSAAAAGGRQLPDGLYTIKPTASSMPFEVYCDMSNGGYTLVATVANGDAQHWIYNTDDGDRGQMSSMWENGATLGTVNVNTPSTNADFKSEAFNSVRGSSIMIKYKNSFLLSTNPGCISDTLRGTLNSYRFACGGSEAMSGASPVCGHSCAIQKSVSAVEPAFGSNGSPASFLYIKAGEKDGVQDTNKDRAYFSSNNRGNVDYPEGLGSYCLQPSGARTNDVGIRDDHSVRPSDLSIFYTIWVQ